MGEERISPEEYLQRLQTEMSANKSKEDAEAQEAKEAPQAETTEQKEVKKKKKKKRKKKNYLLRFAIFILVLGGIIYALQSPLFYVNNIEVVGNEFYTPAQVIELSGLTTGKNLIFEVKTRPARDRLLETPYIRLAKIQKIPMGTLRINLTERIEYACIPFEEGYILIDNEGMVLSITDKKPELTVLDGMIIKTMEPGVPLGIEQAYLLTDTLDLLKAVENTDLYFQRVYFSTVLVRAYINENYYCEGSPSEIMNNIDGIRRLMEEQYSQGISKGVIRVGSDGYFSFSPKID